MKRARIVATIALLAFALGSLAFAAVKEIRLRAAPPTEATPTPDGVVVYYFHKTARCTSCNTIEKLTRAVLDRQFASELADGQVRWELVNLDTHPDLAAKLEVSGSNVVLADYLNGEPARHRVLDEAWRWYDKPEIFEKVITERLRGFLQGTDE